MSPPVQVLLISDCISDCKSNAFQVATRYASAKYQFRLHKSSYFICMFYPLSDPLLCHSAAIVNMMTYFGIFVIGSTMRPAFDFSASLTLAKSQLTVPLSSCGTTPTRL